MLNKFTLSLLLLVLTAFYACKETASGPTSPNKAPTTKVFLNPDSTVSQQQSRIQLYWSGDDPDGIIAGFYFSWDSTNWTFTAKNDSLFSLRDIGSLKVFDFLVSAVDNQGNGVYDTDVYQNGIHYGPEPFTDLNGNGKWDAGESFIDIGLIDPHPASVKLPIKNSAPTVAWSSYSTHPDTSFPAMSFGWAAADIDGESTIQSINIALNDTTKPTALNGAIRWITITVNTKDFSNPNPLMDIYVSGDPNNRAINGTGNIIQLPGLRYDANNIFYVQTEDISGAKSPWISSATQPASKEGWYVKKPKGKFLIVDDYKIADKASDFYITMMDSVQKNGTSLKGRFDVYDITNQKPPYLNNTFLETIKLFDCVIWYSDNDPSLDLASATAQKFLDAKGKIFFALQFPQNVDPLLPQLQGIIPITTDKSEYQATMLAGRTLSDSTHTAYPTLLTTGGYIRARAFYLLASALPVYFFSDNAKFPRSPLPGWVGFENSDKTKFCITVPLHVCNGIPGSVAKLFNQVLFTDFNLTP